MSDVPISWPDSGRTAPMRLLAQGIPLSLLLDLALGPFSEELLEHEVVVPAPPT